MVSFLKSPPFDRDGGAISKAAKINSEIQSVLSLMRQNTKWGLGPRFLDEVEQDEPLMEDFRALRRELFSHPSAICCNPMAFLSPFLAVIRSERTNIPITGAALSAINKFLTLEMLSVDSENAGAAIHHVVDSVISCKFEVTDQASEEIVLAKILQVLLSSVKCSAGVLLADRDVCRVVNSCLRIVLQFGSKRELLQRLACSTMQDMIRTIFARITELPEEEVGEEPSTEGTMNVPDGRDQEKEKPESPEPSREEETEENPSEVNSSSVIVVMQGAAIQLGSLHSRASERAQSSGQELPQEPLTKKLNPKHYGIACLVEILHHLCSLLNFETSEIWGAGGNSIGGNLGEVEVPLFAMGLIQSALEMGGPSLSLHKRLLSLVQDELFRNILQLGLSPHVLPLSQVLSLCLTLHASLKCHLKRQLEAFLLVVIARPLSQGAKFGLPPGVYLQQEVVLEALLDLYRQPYFALELYCNYDCDVDCTDMLREITNLVSKAAFPVNSPLTVVNVLALRVLLAVQFSLDARLAMWPPGLPPPPSLSTTREEMESFWDWEKAAELAPDSADFFRKRRSVKKKLQLAVEHFNRDPKKGIQFLQGAGFLSPGDEPDPLSIARFIRHAPPGLSKAVLGEYLGDHREPNVSVLKAFAGLFNFEGMRLDVALRSFLEHFRLPGEAQKIERIVDNFAARYYGECHDVLLNQDSAHILAYSVIMLNTDLHNPQVKKKMALQDFIRNNRGINNGKDLPKSMLEQIYESISKDEITISPDSADMAPGLGTTSVLGAHMTSGRWLDLLRRAPEGVPFIQVNPSSSLDFEVFSATAGPTLAALSIIFDNADEDALLEECRDGFLALARLAAHFRLEEVLDDVIIAICRYTTLQDSSTPVYSGSTDEDPVQSFLHDSKARIATSAAFEIAANHGDQIRASWRNLLDCVINLHKMGILPASVLSGEPSLNPEVSQNSKTQNPPLTTLALLNLNPNPQMKRKPSGLFSRVSQFLYLEDPSDSLETSLNPSENSDTYLNPNPSESLTLALDFVGSLNVDALFSDSRFLQSDSLCQLARALAQASAPPPANPKVSPAIPPPLPPDPDTSCLCLELLLRTTLANRDRLAVVWPILCGHLAAVLSSVPPPPLAVAERAVVGLLRLLRRLVPYKEAPHGEDLLRDLALVQRLDASLAIHLCPRIARELLLLMKVCSPHVRSPLSWRVLCDLLGRTAHQVEASEVGFRALAHLGGGGGGGEGEEVGESEGESFICPGNFLPFLEASRKFVGSKVGGLEMSIGALDLMAGTVKNLEIWAAQGEDLGEKGMQELGELWLRLALAIRGFCLDGREPIRTHALGGLRRVLLGVKDTTVGSTTASTGGLAPGGASWWAQVFSQVVFVVVDDLLEAVPRSKESFAGTVQLALQLLSRVFLHCLPILEAELALNPQRFRSLWLSVLSRFEAVLALALREGGGGRGGNGEDWERLVEIVPELLKNCLKVMHARGLLVPSGVPATEEEVEGEVENLWELTRRQVEAMVPQLWAEAFPEEVENVVESGGNRGEGEGEVVSVQ